MDRYTQLERNVIERACEWAAHRRRIHLLQIDGKDAEAAEQDSLFWTSECLLEKAVSNLEFELERYS